MADPLKGAREALKRSRTTDRDKESIGHLEDAMHGLLVAIDPSAKSDLVDQNSDDSSSEGDEDPDAEEGSGEGDGSDE